MVTQRVASSIAITTLGQPGLDIAALYNNASVARRRSLDFVLNTTGREGTTERME